jgi:hypothetical protein
MLRPLPPFRVRPLKKAAVRKASASDEFRDLADGEPVSIKGLRRSLKLSRPAPASRLRVLGRGALGQV